MNEYEVLIHPAVINFAPQSVLEEILQNVRTICSTPKFSVPMDRELGVDTSFLDQPMSSAANKYKAEVITAVRKFEPRARITRIEFFRDEEARTFYPKIYIKVIA